MKSSNNYTWAPLRSAGVEMGKVPQPIALFLKMRIDISSLS
jgi:hypothetical protein